MSVRWPIFARFEALRLSQTLRMKCTVECRNIVASIPLKNLVWNSKFDSTAKDGVRGRALWPLLDLEKFVMDKRQVFKEVFYGDG